MRLEPERFFDVDDERVLVFVHVTAEGEGSGVPVEMRNAYELTIRDLAPPRRDPRPNGDSCSGAWWGSQD